MLCLSLHVWPVGRKNALHRIINKISSKSTLKMPLNTSIYMQENETSKNWQRKLSSGIAMVTWAKLHYDTMVPWQQPVAAAVAATPAAASEAVQ